MSGLEGSAYEQVSGLLTTHLSDQSHSAPTANVLSLWCSELHGSIPTSVVPVESHSELARALWLQLLSLTHEQVSAQAHGQLRRAVVLRRQARAIGREILREVAHGRWDWAEALRSNDEPLMLYLFDGRNSAEQDNEA